MGVVPLSVILSWPRSNYVNPERRGPAAIIVTSILTVLASFFVFTLLYLRRQKKFTIDIFFISLAYILSLGLTASVLLATTRYGWDRHLWDVEPKYFLPGRRISWISQLLYLSSATATKLGLLFIYRRLYSHLGFRRVVDGLIVITATYYITFVLVLVLECRPLSFYWRFLVIGAQGRCIDETVTLLGSAIANVAIDVCMLALPMRMFFSLRVPRSQLIQLIFIFSVGFSVIVASVMRGYSTYYTLAKTYDLTWYANTVFIWLSAEVNIGIICACFPWCRPLAVWLQQSMSNFLRLRSASSSANTMVRPELPERPRLALVIEKDVQFEVRSAFSP